PPRPNPASSRTVIAFELPRPSHVRLAVYDVLGRGVGVLVDGALGAGAHEAVLDGASLSVGTYAVRLEAGGRVAARRVTLVRERPRRAAPARGGRSAPGASPARRGRSRRCGRGRPGGRRRGRACSRARFACSR